jgi:hypothetical protein
VLQEKEKLIRDIFGNIKLNNMKGRINKLSRGWVVEYLLPGPPFVGELPLLMDETTFPKDRELFVVGSEVSFKIVEQWEILLNMLRLFRKLKRLNHMIIGKKDVWRLRSLSTFHLVTRTFTETN